MSVMQLSDAEYNVLIKSAIQSLWCGTHIEEAKQFYDHDYRKLTLSEIVYLGRKVAGFALKMHEKNTRMSAKEKGRLYNHVDDLLNSLEDVTEHTLLKGNPTP